MRPTRLRTTLGLCLLGTFAIGRLPGQEHQHPPGQPTSDTGATPLYDNLITLATPSDKIVGQNSAKAVLQVAVRHLAGEMAARAGRTNLAVQQLGKAVSLEDELIYDEPPDWYMPIRQRLGAVLLAAGRPKQAEKVYRADLVHRPENGWSLYGLAQSLKAQKRTQEAALVEKRFEKAWKTADVKPAEK